MLLKTSIPPLVHYKSCIKNKEISFKLNLNQTCLQKAHIEYKITAKCSPDLLKFYPGRKTYYDLSVM